MLDAVPRPPTLIILLLFLTPVTDPFGSLDEAKSAKLEEAVVGRRLTEAVRAFHDLAKPTAADHYLTGFALMELHRPQDAKPRLEAARRARFEDWPGWPTVSVLMARIKTAEELAPPLSTLARPEPAIVTHAGSPTAWSSPVLAALPEFAAVGRSIFGKDVPSIRLYLFADRPDYDRFYGALFGVTLQTAWQDGTGTLNVVTFCERDRQGNTTRVAGIPETISCVLHEFGHAWFGTYLMDRYNKDWLSPAIRRPWLDEGLADLVASLREPAFLERREAWLKDKVRNGVASPSFNEIADHDSFYQKGDTDVHYWVTALFVAELLGKRERAPETIRKILDAVGRSGDVDESVMTVTGKNLKTEFDRVVRRFW